MPVEQLRPGGEHAKTVGADCGGAPGPLSVVQRGKGNAGFVVGSTSHRVSLSEFTRGRFFLRRTTKSFQQHGGCAGDRARMERSWHSGTPACGAQADRGRGERCDGAEFSNALRSTSVTN